MVKFEELENKILNSRGNFSFTNDGKGKRTYVIFSEELKKTLRDKVHEGIQNGEWQINHTIGEGIIRYRKKQDGIFGSYWKNLKNNSPDEFVVLSESQSSEEKKEFEETKQRMAETRERMANNRLSNQWNQSLHSGEGSYISYTGDENVLRETFGILDRKKQEENAGQSSQNQQQFQIYYEKEAKQINFPFFTKPRGS